MRFRVAFPAPSCLEVTAVPIVTPAHFASLAELRRIKPLNMHRLMNQSRLASKENGQGNEPASHRLFLMPFPLSQYQPFMLSNEQVVTWSRL
jgi:hypothetical protein